MLQKKVNGKTLTVVGNFFHYNGLIRGRLMCNHAGDLTPYLSELFSKNDPNEHWISLEGDSDPVVRRLVVENLERLRDLAEDPEPFVSERASYLNDLII